jgi:hypothetical protein
MFGSGIRILGSADPDPSETPEPEHRSEGEKLTLWPIKFNLERTKADLFPVLWIRIRIGSGSRRAKNDPKIEKS